MPRKRTPAKKRAKSTKSKRPAGGTAVAGTGLDPVDDGLNPAQRTFALAYLSNGFNGTQAYLTAYPGVKETTAATESWRHLRNPKIAAFLQPLLEAAWKPFQMGGEQALGRVAVLAMQSPDARVRLAALRTILEQSGKLKTVPDSIDALAAALRADLDAHKSA